jgi:hypothetical protein
MVRLTIAARVSRVEENGQGGSQEGKIEESGYEEGDTHLMPAGQQSQFCPHKREGSTQRDQRRAHS